MIQINGISSGNFKTESVDVIGFRIKSYVQGGAGAVDHSIDPTKLLLNADLKRGDVPYDLLGPDFKAVAAAANFFGAGYESAIGVAGAYPVSADRVCFVTDIIFETAFNLRGTDQILVDATLMDGYYNATGLVLANCMVEIEAIKVIGLEWGTSKIRTLVVPTNEARFQRTLGDNISEIILLDKDNLQAFDNADFAVQNLKLTSDKIVEDWDKIDLLQNRRKIFEDREVSDARGNSLVVFKSNDETDLDGVKIEIVFNPAMVTASRFILVYREKFVDQRLINLASKRKDKHRIQNVQKLR